MSYCRFSSNDWSSDVYVYESHEHRFVVHVAGMRYQYDGELPPEIELPDATSPAYANIPKEERLKLFEPWVERHNLVMKLMREAEMVPINGGFDGEYFEADSPGGAADYLEKLEAAGYNVPDGVIGALREENGDG